MPDSLVKLSPIKTGIAEFDNILGGGLPAFRSYLLQGSPGSGKTTLSLQFLLEGVKNGESVLYVTLSETAEELRAVAASHGLSLEGVHLVELVPEEGHLEPENQITMYQPSEIELNVTIKKILSAVEQLAPKRVIIDSLSEVKLLAQSTLRFRRQVMALKQFFAGRACTVLFLDDRTSLREEDLQLESITHGVISLEQLSPEYGAERRRLRIIKLRGQKYRGGYHDFSIAHGGLKMFPRIVAHEHYDAPETQIVKSGVPQMDALMGGGLLSGSSVLLLGPAGVGKSTLAIQYAIEAARRGEASVLFTFDERKETMLARADGLNMPLREFIDAGFIEVRAIDPAELSPGEFAHTVRLAVDGKQGHPVKIVLIDSLNGYMNAMPDEQFLTAQMHELLTYLGHRDVVTFLVIAQHGLLSHAMKTTIDTSYLADAVVLFRYFEAAGEVKQLLSVLKKRNGQHERTIREFSLGANGIQIGAPLTKFQGVLTGTPVFLGEDNELILRDD